MLTKQMISELIIPRISNLPMAKSADILRVFMVMSALWLTAIRVRAAEPVGMPTGRELSWPGEKIDTWNGYTRHKFTVDGCAAWVVEPRRALPGEPWAWCMEFPDAFTERGAAPGLLTKGFYYAHISVGNTFGCPAAVKHFNAFYEALTAKGLGPESGPDRHQPRRALLLPLGG